VCTQAAGVQRESAPGRGLTCNVIRDKEYLPFPLTSLIPYTRLRLPGYCMLSLTAISHMHIPSTAHDNPSKTPISCKDRHVSYSSPNKKVPMTLQNEQPCRDWQRTIAKKSTTLIITLIF
jgi:hypothetical protein